MIKIYLYNLRVELINHSHLKNQKFFEVVENDLDADFLFISITEQTEFFKRISIEERLKNKKIILYNFTEPISFGAARLFLSQCTNLGIDSKNILFHSTNHFLDKFNCLHRGLSITDHIFKSQLDTGFVDFNERFLKFCFVNNTLRTPRALVINEVLSRNLNFNQAYISANGDYWYGDRYINLYPNIKNNLHLLQSHDHTDVHRFTSYQSDKNFQSVYKNSFFNFTIETFSDFGMDNLGFNSHLTEKTIRNFAHKIPFLLLISSEEQMRIIEDMGFVLFNDLFNFKINCDDKQKTINEYTDVIETFSKMKSIDVKNLVLTREYKERIEHNYNQYLYYKNLDVKNIYEYILSNDYEDKNQKMINIEEKNDIPLMSIISTDI